jgi:hypothetical protein
LWTIKSSALMPYFRTLSWKEKSRDIPQFLIGLRNFFVKR